MPLLLRRFLRACPLFPPLLLSACGSTTEAGPAPTISELTLQTIDPSDTTRVSASLHVHDAAGLTTLFVHPTLDDGKTTTALPPLAVDGVVEGQLDATAKFTVRSKQHFHTGVYQISVTATEGGAPSNALTATFTVE